MNSLFVPGGTDGIEHGVLFLGVGPVLLRYGLARVDNRVLDKHVLCITSNEGELVIRGFISPVWGRQGDKLHRVCLVGVLTLQDVDTVMVFSLGVILYKPLL